jgi:uncharacterized protein YdaU (DUF1376 family)
MSKAPAMPMYWDAYLADTTHLTTEEHGAYMLLLAAMWRRNGVVPDDDKDNARILGLTPVKWRKIKARLMATISGFIVENDTITQEKLQKTWKNTQEKIDKNKQNGAKGGRAAASKNNDLAQANATVSVKPKASIPEPEPEPIREETYVSCEISTPAAIDEVAQAIQHFNATASQASWPAVQKTSPSRRSALKGRIKDVGGLAAWCEAITRASQSAHLTGQNNRGWTATFDWLANPTNFTKLMEGNYDDRANTNPSNPSNTRRETPHEAALRIAGVS